MRHLKQLSIILTITCVAEILKYYIPLPIPSSIYGLVIMFLLLVTRTIHIEAVKETANFFDRDYAGNVYPCRGWTSRKLVSASTSAAAGLRHYRGDDSPRDGLHRPDRSVYHPEEQEW